MEHNFEHDEFEEYLQRQVKNHRMFPADGVWREIHSKLHGTQKWPALTVAAFLLISATLLICVHFAPKPNIFAIQPSIETIASTTPALIQKGNVLNTFSASNPFYNKARQVDEIPPKSTDIDLLTPEQFIDKKPAPTNEVGNELLVAIPEPQINDNLSDKTKARIIPLNNTSANNWKVQIASPRFDVSSLRMLQATFVEARNPLSANISTVETSNKNIANEVVKDQSQDVALHTISKPESHKNSLGIQLYVAPSISYRKLGEDPNSLREKSEAGVDAGHATDINKVVRHKPGTGIEAGVSFKGVSARPPARELAAT